MANKFTFDDVLIEPQFSEIKSRKDVDLSVNEPGMPYMRLPIISANMDTITESDMCQAIAHAGGLGCLHRFCSIEDNVRMFQEGWYGVATGQTGVPPLVSIGLGSKELERAEALSATGAYTIVIDVAHGAQMSVVEQVKELKKLLPHIYVIVGNFATPKSIVDFRSRLKVKERPILYKVGIGPGSACTTRIKTGCGVPQLSAIQECAEIEDIIADGGMRTPGDIAKALAAGAKYVMLGGMLAGTTETPGDTFIPEDEKACPMKHYRGSASYSSYISQGKDSSATRTPEGESFLVPHKGPVSTVLEDIEGGLRSALTYVGASNLKEFRKEARFIQISVNTIMENKAHGKS